MRRAGMMRHTRSISELSSSSLSLSESEDDGKDPPKPAESVHSHHTSVKPSGDGASHRIHLQWKLSAEEQIEASSLKVRGGFIESEPMFDSEGTAWALRIAPKGYLKSSKGWIGTCLAGLVEWNRLRYGITRRRLRAVKWTLRNSRTMRIVGEMVDSASTDDLMISSHEHGNVCWLNTFALASLRDHGSKGRSQSKTLSSQAWMIECRFELVSVDRIFQSNDEERLLMNPMVSGATLTISPLFTCHFIWTVLSNDSCVVDPATQEACVISPLFHSLKSGSFWRLKMRQHSLRSKSEGMAFVDLLCDFTRNLFGPSVGVLAQCSVAHPFSGSVKRISGVLHSGMVAPPVTLQFPHFKSMPPTRSSISAGISSIPMKRSSTVKLCEFTATIKIFGFIRMPDTVDDTGASVIDEVEILQPMREDHRDPVSQSRSELHSSFSAAFIHSTSATLGSLRESKTTRVPGKSHDSRPSLEIKRLTPLTPGKSSSGGSNSSSSTSDGSSGRISFSAASDSTELRAAVEVDFPHRGELTRETMMDLTPPMTQDEGEESDRKLDRSSSGIAALFTSLDEKDSHSAGSIGYDGSYEYDSHSRSKRRTIVESLAHSHGASALTASAISNEVRELDKWFRDEFPHSYWIYLKEFILRGVDSRQRMAELDEDSLQRLFPEMPLSDRLMFQRKAEILRCEFDVQKGKRVSLTDAKSGSRSRASSGASASTSADSDRLSSTAMSKRKKKTAKLRRLGSGSGSGGGSSIGRATGVSSSTKHSHGRSKMSGLRRPPRLRSDTVSTTASGKSDGSSGTSGLSPSVNGGYQSDSIGDILNTHHPYYHRQSLSKAHSSDTPSLTDVD